jgi:hypothetical protein
VRKRINRYYREVFIIDKSYVEKITLQTLKHLQEEHKGYKEKKSRYSFYVVPKNARFSLRTE